MTHLNRPSNVVGLIAIASLCALALAPAAASVARATGPAVRAQLEVARARVHAGVKADFNGDGFGDLAIGVPARMSMASRTPESVNVIYGSPHWSREDRQPFFSQASPGVLGAAADKTRTSDRRSPLAISTMRLHRSRDRRARRHCRRSPERRRRRDLGWFAVRADVRQWPAWTQATSGVTGSPDNGTSLVVPWRSGTSNGDNVPRSCDRGCHTNRRTAGPDAGAVNVVYGKRLLPGADDSQSFYGTTSHGEFGSALGAGQLDVFAGQELAIGAPHAAVGGHDDVGQVLWLRGSQDGLGQLKALGDKPLEEGAHCGGRSRSATLTVNERDERHRVGLPRRRPGHLSVRRRYIEVYSATPQTVRTIPSFFRSNLGALKTRQASARQFPLATWVASAVAPKTRCW